ncbi:TetR/AcrR family transcriptional regulator [Paraburkholderia caledonica]|uniref:AcrR family transcriptional regulator n=1 Tax=Paraburkholderia caledonica TaxID=134536 RepID=A0ABU1KYU3_9BURK|nr:TetR/AcrR family transcriptional regulator [Paraburkholderia caledonica]MDR6376145.1 AcrR family transcriptional regulator [Paraburkholderia caledonica]
MRPIGAKENCSRKLKIEFMFNFESLSNVVGQSATGMLRERAGCQRSQVRIRDEGWSEGRTKNKERILKVASRLFRGRSAKAVSAGKVREAAGLTHGAMYSHFRSKDELISEAFLHASDEFISKMETAANGLTNPVCALIERNISQANRDSPGAGCPLASASSEPGRRGEEAERSIQHRISANCGPGRIVIALGGAS